MTLTSTCRHCGVSVEREEGRPVWMHVGAGTEERYWYCRGAGTVAGPTVNDEGIVP